MLTDSFPGIIDLAGCFIENLHASKTANLTIIYLAGMQRVPVAPVHSSTNCNVSNCNNYHGVNYSTIVTVTRVTVIVLILCLFMLHTVVRYQNNRDV